MKILIVIKRIFWNGQERRLRALWRLVLHMLLIFLISIIFSIALESLYFLLLGSFNSDIRILSFLEIFENPWVNAVVFPGGMLLIILAATMISGRWVDRRKFKDFGFHFSRAWWLDLAFGLTLGAMLMGLVFLFGWVTGSIQITGFMQSFSGRGQFLSEFFQGLIFYIMVGFYEELLSRGYHLVNLSEGFYGVKINKRWALLLALVVSSVVFGLLHMSNPHASWISTVNIMLAGIFLGLGMILTGNLSISIGLHITWNFFQGNVFGFPVSGTRTGATLIATELVGPKWLNGGAFGPEAGLMGLAAMLIGSLLTVLWVRRSKSGRLELKESLTVYEPQNRRRRQLSESDN